MLSLSKNGYPNAAVLVRYDKKASNLSGSVDSGV